MALFMFSMAMVDGVASNQSSVPREEGCLNPELPEYSYSSLVETQNCWGWTSRDNTWWLLGKEGYCVPDYGHGNITCIPVICKTWLWNDFIKCYVGLYPPAEDTLVPDTTGMAH